MTRVEKILACVLLLFFAFFTFTGACIFYDLFVESQMTPGYTWAESSYDYAGNSYDYVWDTDYGYDDDFSGDIAFYDAQQPYDGEGCTECQVSQENVNGISVTNSVNDNSESTLQLQGKDNKAEQKANEVKQVKTEIKRKAELNVKDVTLPSAVAKKKGLSKTSHRSKASRASFSRETFGKKLVKSFQESKNAEKARKEVKKIATDETKSDDKKMKEINASVFPLTPEEVKLIREKSQKIKKALEEEGPRNGRVRVLYHDPFEVPRINVAVNYASTVCFWSKIDRDGGVVVGSSNFDVKITNNEKCIVIFPKKEFKETNVAVFIGELPVHFLVREVYDQEDVDVNVIFREKPDVSDVELLKRIVTRSLNGDLKRLLQRKKPSREEKKMGIKEKLFFDGRRKYVVYVVSKEKADESFPFLKRMCVGEDCYVIEEFF